MYGVSNFGLFCAERNQCICCCLLHLILWLILNRNEKLTRTRWLDPYCVVRLVIVCLFVCHPDRNPCRHSYSFTIHRRSQSKSGEANARLYNNNNNNNNDDNWAKRIQNETTRSINTNSNNNNKKTNNNDQASHIEMAATTIHINSSNNNDDNSDSNDEASHMNNTNNTY